MTTMTKVLVGVGSLVVFGGGGWGLYYYGTWEVSKGRHREWNYKVTRTKGEYTVSVGRVGFGMQEIGTYPSKGAALERAITYIDQEVGPGTGRPTLTGMAATPTPQTAGFADQTVVG